MKSRTAFLLVPLFFGSQAFDEESVGSVSHEPEKKNPHNRKAEAYANKQVADGFGLSPAKEVLPAPDDNKGKPPENPEAAGYIKYKSGERKDKIRCFFYHV
jgi:hypothetical protein